MKYTEEIAIKLKINPKSDQINMMKLLYKFVQAMSVDITQTENKDAIKKRSLFNKRCFPFQKT